MPDLTVVLPTYERRSLLLRAVRSIQNQTYREFRLCIYDNASTDGTEELCRQLAADDPRIVYFRQPTNIGPSKNFRFGMERVDTEYFMFASDDDVPLPNFFRSALDLFARYPDARLAATETLEMTESGLLVFAPLCLWERDGFFTPSDGLVSILGGRHPSWNSIVFRRSVIDEVGFFNPDLGQLIDLEYTLRICSRYPFATTFEPGSIFIRHPGSGGEKTDPRSSENFHAAIENLVAAESITPANARLLEKEMLSMLRQRLLEGATKAILRGDRPVAAEFVRTHNEEFGITATSFALSAAIGAPQPLGRDLLQRAVSGRQRMRAALSEKALTRRVGQQALSNARRYLRNITPAL